MMEQRTVAFGKGPTLCLSLCLCCCAVHILDVNGLLCLLGFHWVRQLTNLINGCTPSYLKVVPACLLWPSTLCCMAVHHPRVLLSARTPASHSARTPAFHCVLRGQSLRHNLPDWLLCFKTTNLSHSNLGIDCNIYIYLI